MSSAGGENQKCTEEASKTFGPATHKCIQQALRFRATQPRSAPRRPSDTLSGHPAKQCTQEALQHTFGSRRFWCRFCSRIGKLVLHEHLRFQRVDAGLEFEFCPVSPVVESLAKSAPRRTASKTVGPPAHKCTQQALRYTFEPPSQKSTQQALRCTFEPPSQKEHPAGPQVHFRVAQSKVHPAGPQVHFRVTQPKEHPAGPQVSSHPAKRAPSRPSGALSSHPAKS